MSPTAKRPLTDATIRGAKPGAKVRKLSDGHGLQLWVTPAPAAGKFFKLAYRFGDPPKQKLLPLGAYPVVGLAEARQAALEARALVAKGIDPGEHRKAQKLAKADSDAYTFAKAATEFVAKKAVENKAPRTMRKITWLLSLADPFIGGLPIADITAPQVLAALRPVEAANNLETARRLRAIIGEVFRFAIASGRATNDPTPALRAAIAAPTVTHRAAILDPVAFGALLRAIDGYNGRMVTRAALQLQALLFPRPGELRQARWDEFEGDVWTIPAGRMKMKREHKIPLPRQAVAILNELRRVTGRGELLFPGLRSFKRPLSDAALGAALRTMGIPQDAHSPHGFRATAATMLNECGKFSVSGIEAALAHQDPDKVRAAYTRGSYWAERVEIAQWWADRCDEMKAGRL